MSKAHAFSVEVAQEFGVNEAIFIQNMQHWITLNMGKKHNQFNGKTWTYNTYQSFCYYFPYWTRRQIEHLVQKLIDKGVLITFQKDGADRQKGLFYAFSDEMKWIGDITPIENGQNVTQNCATVTQNCATHSYIYTDTKPDINGQSTLANDDLLFFDEFYKLYDKKVKPDRAKKEWKKNKLWEKWDDIKANIELRQRHEKNWVKCSERNKQFIPHPDQYLKNKGWEDELLFTHKECKCQKNKQDLSNNFY